MKEHDDELLQAQTTLSMHMISSELLIILRRVEVLVVDMWKEATHITGHISILPKINNIPGPMALPCLNSSFEPRDTISAIPSFVAACIVWFLALSKRGGQEGFKSDQPLRIGISKDSGSSGIDLFHAVMF